MFSKSLFSFKNFFWAGVLLSLTIGIYTRFVGITQFPPSLYWEEAALGYDAYSILQTGHDVHGHFLPIVAFESFGDYKPSFYFYSLVPSIAIFGLTDFAVRFPSAFSGILLIVGVGLLAKELGNSLVENDPRKNKVANLPKTLQVIAMLVISLSPWAIEFSRGGWEVNEATMLLVYGLWLEFLIRKRLLSNVQKVFSKSIIFCTLVSVLLLALSMYTYHSTRVIAPILLLGFWVEIVVELWLKNKKQFFKLVPNVRKKLLLIMGAGLLFTLLISPIIISLRSPETQERFDETSLFADGRQVTLSNELIANTQPHWLGKILYHRYVISAEMLAQNYLTHFTFNFLFVSGDNNPRHSTQIVGEMYLGEFFILLAGLYFLISKRTPLVYFIFFWLLVGITPAAITTATPHALRILPSMPTWILILTAGVYQWGIWLLPYLQKIFDLLHLQKFPFAFLTLVFLFSIFYGWQFISYWRFYSLIYSKEYSNEWQYGYKQMVTDLAKDQTIFPTLPVEVTREYGRPSMYYWFYTKTDPREVQAEEPTAKKDQGEFLQFKNINFVDQVNNLTQKTLVASTQSTYEDVSKKSHTQVLNTVNDPVNNVIWVIYLAQN